MYRLLLFMFDSVIYPLNNKNLFTSYKEIYVNYTLHSLSSHLFI